MRMFNKTTLALAIAALAGGALAQSASAPAPSPSPVTANVTVVNDYRYRGMTQSNYKPAIQGGFDYAHESGFYIGNWNSSISWISDGYDTGQNGNRNVSAPLEMDFYAGYKTELLGKGQVTDVGILQYYYEPLTFQVTPVRQVQQIVLNWEEMVAVQIPTPQNYMQPKILPTDHYQGFLKFPIL